MRRAFTISCICVCACARARAPASRQRRCTAPGPSHPPPAGSSAPLAPFGGAMRTAACKRTARAPPTPSSRSRESDLHGGRVATNKARHANH
eukprot:8846231-Pyramimonas_sp.AAC.1